MIIQLIAQVEKDIVMMKWDLKSTFRHISINSYDYWLFIFEWNDKFYIDMFLSFELWMILWIFNLFFEVLHWVFEILLGWNLTYYLNDFLFIFLFDIDIQIVSNQYNSILISMGFISTFEKNMNEYIIIHLSFEFDLLKMQIHFSSNKK